MTKPNRLRAIDLYAGVGGWALGLHMANVEVVRSFEWWGPAATTHEANLDGIVSVANIRTMDFDALPRNIDVVVGSPPCTQFSYSNRGGSGDVADGLKDLEQFLAVVQYLKPKFWVLENVPRVKKVLEQEIKPGGALEQFSDLFLDAEVEVFDMSEFGLPQRRKRCIAGNFDFNLLRQYSQDVEAISLGDVVSSLESSKEPLYLARSTNLLSDNDQEEVLSAEEARFNRDMKEAHPIYNGMPFPEPIDRTSRTVTATCTRVSRESLVVEASTPGEFRRLSVRERASLQGFPIEFQFLGKSHAEKLKMIGNAIPPYFAYYIAQTFSRQPAAKFINPKNIDANAYLLGAKPIDTKPDKVGNAYPANRRFRFAIPYLRFKSGTRFELSNTDGPESWKVSFYFGDSKRIIRHTFTSDELANLVACAPDSLARHLTGLRERAQEKLPKTSSEILQSIWVNHQQGIHPFSILDLMGEFSETEIAHSGWTESDKLVAENLIEKTLYESMNRPNVGRMKIKKYSVDIIVGAIVSVVFNESLTDQDTRKRAA